MSSTYRFVIKGRFKPYVRMTQRGKWVVPKAQQYLASKKRLGFDFQRQMHEHGWEMLPATTPLWIQILKTPAHHNRDIDNEAKALLDAMSGVVFPDDRWVDGLSIWRADAKDGEESTHISVGVLSDQA